MTEPGDLIIFKLEGHDHYAVYVGDENIVHFTDDSFIKEEDLKPFRDKLSSFTIDFEESPYNKEKIVKRARSKVGYKKFGEYSVGENNSEHFARWCRCDKKISTQRHLKISAEAKPGDIIMFKRNVIYHFAVYVGDGKIVHFTDDSFINEEDFEIVRGNSSYEIESIVSPFSKEEIVERARSKLGCKTFGKYNFATNNCEHFATWCRYDKKMCRQALPIFRSFVTSSSNAA